MYRPLRRHTYHSVTNNTNNSEIILDSHWSKDAHADFSLVKTFSSTREVKQKVNKPSQLGLAAFFLPFFLISDLFVTWRYDLIAGQDGGESAEDGHQEDDEEHLEGGERRGRPMLTRTLAQL